MRIWTCPHLEKRNYTNQINTQGPLLQKTLRWIDRPGRILCSGHLTPTLQLMKMMRATLRLDTVHILLISVISIGRLT